MFNLFRMDCRRLFKSRSFYIILAIVATLVFLVVLLVSTISDPQVLDAMQANGAEIDDTDRWHSEEIRQMTQLHFVDECLNSVVLLALTGIGVTLLAGGDFSSGYIKNICFAKPRRYGYVFSKILLTGIYSGILTVLGVFLSLAFPPLLGLHPAADPFLRILQYTFWLWLPHWALGLMALALVLLTRSSTLGIVMAILSGSGLTATLTQLFCQQFHWPALEQYLLGSVAYRQCVPFLKAPQMAMILACVAGWGAVYTAVSLFSMEKKDI